ncbi:SDR family NAD(P)-dependent oxidoreductase [Pedococcus dokdonensis]|uniref:SDR family NAD(P)-dependent oxidoreductase n=1 Tax=Pedococcus dokdonensis TaxID=443156 RepID=UPI001E6119D8|nr:SDR family oxidoreductase [Pedococcus dokdonensis]
MTGASRGIGVHLSAALEDAGYTVERGSRAVAPVTDRAAVERWVADVVGRHGRIDLLVNNAGVIDREVGLLESDPDQWWETVEVNLRGPYLMTRAVLPHMVAAGSGRIVNINSGAAYRNYDIATAYNVGKGALARLTAATGLNADRGVRAFDLAPGVVRTDMTEAMDAHRDRTEWTEPAVVAELLLAIARGELDDWNGRMVRAGIDTPESLQARAAQGLAESDRTLGLLRWGDDDPLT